MVTEARKSQDQKKGRLLAARENLQLLLSRCKSRDAEQGHAQRVRVRDSTHKELLRTGAVSSTPRKSKSCGLQRA
jgi:hypothetical protein